MNDATGVNRAAGQHTSAAARGRIPPFRALPAPLQQTGYLAVVIGSGIFVLLISIRELNASPYGLSWVLFAGLAMIGGFARLRLPNVPASFSISDIFTIAAALLFGPGAGALAVAIDTLAISVQLAKRKQPLRRLWFNATGPPLAMWLAAHGFFLLVGTGPLEPAFLLLARSLRRARNRRESTVPRGMPRTSAISS